MKRRARLVYVAVLLATLAAVQLRAQALQVEAGYRPFAEAPARIPYSWDMFAIRMDRCAVRWDPPLRVDGEPVATWHDREYPVEFDTVYNRVATYEGATRVACRFRAAARTTATLTCARSDGTVDEHRIDCP